MLRDEREKEEMRKPDNRRSSLPLFLILAPGCAAGLNSLINFAS
jgi:hypothetical protein